MLRRRCTDLCCAAAQYFVARIIASPAGAEVEALLGESGEDAEGHQSGGEDMEDVDQQDP